MKICILGAGALGCAIGAALSEAGHETWLLNRGRAHVEAMNQHGLRVQDERGERYVPVNAAIEAEDVGVTDLVVVLVKSFHTAEAIAGALALIGPQTLVLSLQNGLGHEDILAEVVGRERVLAGKTYVGGVLLAPGSIRAGVAGKQTFIGELDGQLTPRVQAIAEAFNNAGLATTVSDNILGTMWDKLLINVATGALSSITRLTYGAMYPLPQIEATAIAAVQEAMDVARACGVRLSYTDRSDYLDEVLAMFRAVGAQGAELVFCHGNRDFLLDCGPAGSTPFSAQAGGRMMAEAEVVELGGAPALLMHGDQLCTLDEAYMAFRAQARSEAWQQGILGQPLEQRLMIAEMWRMKSKMANSNKAENIMDVTPSEVVRVMATAGVERLIHDGRQVQALLGIGVVAGQHRHRGLRDYRTAVEFAGHEMHRGTGHPATRLDGALVRVQAGEGRQQRRVDVEQAALKMAHKAFGQDAHEAGQHHHIGLKAIHHPGQFGVEGLAAAESLVVDHGGGDAMAGRKLQATGRGLVADHRRDAGGPALALTGVDDGFHVGAAAGDQDDDVFHAA